MRDNQLSVKDDLRRWLSLTGRIRPESLGVALVFAGAPFLYLATVAPTVLWGDDAFLLRMAATGTLRPDGGGHWVWLQLTQLFLRLPWGDTAYRVNLLSVTAASLTVFLVFAAGRALGLSRVAAAAAAISLAVSHTFWSHAVRTEVYTTFTVFLALHLWLWADWQPERPWSIFLSGLLFGPTLLAHQLALLLLPPLCFLLWRQRAWLGWRQRAWLLLAFVAGLLSFMVVIDYQTGSREILSGLYLYFTYSGHDFSNALLDFSWRALPRDTILWLGFLGLQFIGLAWWLGLRGVVGIIHHQPVTAGAGVWLALLILYATSAFFAFSYRVTDQYVFFLPGYVVVALVVGRGWDQWAGRLQGRGAFLALALLVAVPVVTYYSLPRLLAATGFNPLNVRQLPGREPHRFFLWPAKNGYTGAADYGRAALEPLPANSVLLADFTPSETLDYLQVVEGLRPDVRLIKIDKEQNLAAVVATLPPGAAVFLADNNPRYYNLASLQPARLEPAGVIYQLVRERPSLSR
ncbi:MAG: DUF2723 domain-containing protein [Chloroflexi bacterium]|nr:DUF2723 domain-containing protein [Chloroflexota bacterium]MCI0647731.1 DUF2723 domain-containing protein [Chloroflexota bacterium]MCI0731595.1 DUF2723 domain-containing protein [Chloroflexota bacterium]